MEFDYEAVRFKHRNNLVTVTVLEPVEKFVIQGAEYGPIEQGSKVELPRWVAEVLVNQNRARIDEEIGLSDLQKALWRETGEPKLQPLPFDFFFRVKRYIAQLDQDNRESPNAVRLATQQKMEQLLRDLVTHRLLKLMKVALREERLREAKKQMTEEEQWLLDKLAVLLRSWLKRVLEVERHD